jgi:hypothetical protein
MGKSSSSTTPQGALAWGGGRLEQVGPRIAANRKDGAWGQGVTVGVGVRVSVVVGAGVGVIVAVAGGLAGPGRLAGHSRLGTGRAVCPDCPAGYQPSGPKHHPWTQPPPVGVTVVDIELAIEVAINGVSDHGRSEVAWTYVNGLKS